MPLLYRLLKQPGVTSVAPFISEIRIIYLVLGSFTVLCVALLRIGDCVDIILEKIFVLQRESCCNVGQGLAQSLLWYCREISAKAVYCSTSGAVFG